MIFWHELNDGTFGDVTREGAQGAEAPFSQIT